MKHVHVFNAVPGLKFNKGVQICHPAQREQMLQDCGLPVVGNRAFHQPKCDLHKLWTVQVSSQDVSESLALPTEELPNSEGRLTPLWQL